MIKKRYFYRFFMFGCNVMPKECSTTAKPDELLEKEYWELVDRIDTLTADEMARWSELFDYMIQFEE